LKGGGYGFFLKKYSDSQCCWKKYSDFGEGKKKELYNVPCSIKSKRSFIKMLKSKVPLWNLGEHLSVKFSNYWPQVWFDAYGLWNNFLVNLLIGMTVHKQPIYWEECHVADNQ
jgi:hypothetical protein